MSVRDEFNSIRLAVEDVNSSPSEDGGKIDKAVVNYRFAGEGGSSGAESRRCGTCSMFEPPSSCSLVSGVISAEGLCDRWEPVNTGGGWTAREKGTPVGPNYMGEPDLNPDHEMSSAGGRGWRQLIEGRSAGIGNVVLVDWRARLEEFYNQCHDDKGQFCPGVGGEVGTSKPNTVAGKKDYVPGTSVRMGAGLIGDAQVKATLARQKGVPGFEGINLGSGRAGLSKVVDQQAGNIAAAVDRAMAINPDTAIQHSNWYPTAHEWIGEVARETGFHSDAITAATAVLSPGADWAHNTAWAAHMADVINRDPVVTKGDVDSYFVTRVAAWQVKVDKAEAKGGTFSVPKPEYPEGLVGKKISELSDEDAAIAIRGASDVKGGEVKQLGPEGSGGRAGFGDAGKKAIPQSDANLAKAVSVLRNPSTENIDAQLGEAHKVRSFYNNLRDPKNVDNQEVTVDTHHYGVANDEPWGMSSKFVASGKDSVTAAPNTGATGAKGTYPLIVDATRKATDMVNAKYGLKLTPNQVQSIAWENHRARWPSTIRSNAKMTAIIDQAHTDRARGKIDIPEEQKIIEDARLKAGGPTDTEIKTWYAQDLKGETRTDLRVLRGKGGTK